jgi:PAP2 superfamily C-terminal
MLHKHKTFWLQKNFVVSVLFGLALLGASFFANYYANAYIASHASNYVTDILLDNLPVVNVQFLFSEGAVLFMVFVLVTLFVEPKYIPFALKSIAVFIIVRSFFLVLTHMAPPANEIYIDPNDLISRLSWGNDLFFSSHTGLPFLMALIFKKHHNLNYFFFACSAIGGITVLLGHLHYSIDVFSALFISYGIYHISKHLFASDYRRLNQS